MNAAGIETEIKLRVHSARYATQLLSSHGFIVRTPRHFEVNVVLDTDTGALRAAGELLRLRRAGDHVVLTYKGPAESGRHKSREEIEIELPSFPTATLLLDRLGFRERFRYEKFRTEYHRLGDPGVVMLDETPIGDFLEIEGVAHWIDSAARKLGFDESSYITASYGRLFLEWCHENGVRPSDMVFATRDSGAE